MAADPQAVLTFWFGELDADGRADKAHTSLWWSSAAEFDRSVRERFADLHTALMSDEHEAWLAEPRTRLAYVIVLDQFSRNMFRGTPASFASDERALSAAIGGIEREIDRVLPIDQRTFMYMPLMHCERLAVQERCVQLFQVFAEELPKALRPGVQSNVRFAERHCEIVRRFGRFPHRNAILGRASTPEELTFLAEPGSSF